MQPNRRGATLEHDYVTCGPRDTSRLSGNKTTRALSIFGRSERSQIEIVFLASDFDPAWEFRRSLAKRFTARLKLSAPDAMRAGDDALQKDNLRVIALM
ncbi:MAG: hypothetical protein ACFCUS_15240 [Rubrimonas sp.]|uniref:hypothetical protein n=1 Tax=Rubrimonas sp. TaxID=2036015 RepID=UPI002FDD6AFD